MKNRPKFLFQMLILPMLCSLAFATTYTVSTKTALVSRFSSVKPGDTIVVANGRYSWGQLSLTNTKGTATSNWIVLKAQSLGGVVFYDTTYLQFSGTRVMIDGFKFSQGQCSENGVVQFRTTTNTMANDCRLTNITIDNYNSDTAIGNTWVSIYGVRNRVDHCTFINKSNLSPVLVVWYDNPNYPQVSTPTYHHIDSNYFFQRSYLNGNGGEVIRVGTSVNSRSPAYNLIEYNLFEGGIQDDPEVISNKSGNNIYRYNTFRNLAGGLTLRQGRYCSVYGNFFIRDTDTVTSQYGIRAIDKGHKIFNNYIENTNGSSGGLTGLRCPLILFNGLTNSDDTTDPSKAAGYFPADSCIVAFNTVVNCLGGAGLVIGFTSSGGIPFSPKGVVVANNLIKMTKGQAIYIDTTGGTSPGYTAINNWWNAPKGLGNGDSTGFLKKTLTFGTRTKGVLPPPSTVKDAAVGTTNYMSLLNGLDGRGVVRSPVYDIGAHETNGTGNVIASPLDSTLVGAGKPVKTVLPVSLSSFWAYPVGMDQISLGWEMEGSGQVVGIEHAFEKGAFETLVRFDIGNRTSGFLHQNVAHGAHHYRLIIGYNDGARKESPAKTVVIGQQQPTFQLYPNPAKSMVHLLLPTDGAPKELSLIDNNGRSVKVWRSPAGLLQVPIGGLPGGLYRFELREAGRPVRSKPFLID